jgi:hypothetical protein
VLRKGVAADNALEYAFVLLRRAAGLFSHRAPGLFAALYEDLYLPDWTAKTASATGFFDTQLF